MILKFMILLVYSLHTPSRQHWQPRLPVDICPWCAGLLAFNRTMCANGICGTVRVTLILGWSQVSSPKIELCLTQTWSYSSEKMKFRLRI